MNISQGTSDTTSQLQYNHSSAAYCLSMLNSKRLLVFVDKASIAVLLTKTEAMEEVVDIFNKQVEHPTIWFSDALKITFLYKMVKGRCYSLYKSQLVYLISLLYVLSSLTLIYKLHQFLVLSAFFIAFLEDNQQ